MTNLLDRDKTLEVSELNSLDKMEISGGSWFSRLMQRIEELFFPPFGV
jgi:hypothetical protein